MGESALVRAAASSTASGRSSSFSQSSAISAVASSRERSQKSATASLDPSGGTEYSTSPCTRSSSRLVHRSVRFGQACTSSERSGAASITCSRLSRRRSISRSPMYAASPSRAPSVCAIVSVTSEGSRRAASPTQKTPALYAGTSSVAASRARRVFPEPPGPVSVSSRVPARSSRTTSSRSRSRPMNELAGRGRFVFEIVLSGGKLLSPS